jgi:UDP-N-acetylmuramoyl-L-alanyl-D-glutamate--2,6-diaminopimelate ligase
MEVSSHALIQKRCYGTKFEGVAFTNLTQDHLDYHKTMEEYFKAKSLLFLPPQAPAVVNIDCKFGQRLANQIKQFGGTVLTYGTAETADLCFSDAKLTAETTNFTITYKNQSHNVALMLLGRHNIYNALAAIGLALNAGIDLSIAIKAIQQEKPVRGRLEHVKLDGSKANFYVDYAHTPDAIENVLRTLREITDGRLFIVFGAGGDRDRRKRPLMGKAAFNNADYLIITSDNPRSEQPSAIIEDILEGIPGTGVGEQPPSDAPEMSIIEDRREAIAYAVKTANQPGDVVLIAGKGHEDYQIFADHTEHFDDIEELKATAL